MQKKTSARTGVLPADILPKQECYSLHGYVRSPFRNGLNAYSGGLIPHLSGKDCVYKEQI
jgi:hypothetical protein